MRRDYPEHTTVSFRMRFLRPGQVTPPYKSRIYPLMMEFLERDTPSVILHLQRMASQYGEDLKHIADVPQPPVQEPRFDEGELQHWDGAALYYLVRRARPGKIVEIGSGSSTRFMRRAIRDGNLDTKIVVVDAKVKDSWTWQIADTIIEAHFEDVWDDPRLKLDEGDMLFYSGSHQVVPGSDLVMLVNEYIARAPRRIWIQFHDAFLPDDGPSSVRQANVMESYLVYAMLAYGNFEIVLPIWALRAGSGYEISKKAAQILNIPGIQQAGHSIWVLKR